MTEQNNLNNNENYQSLNNPQKAQYNYLFVSEQYTQNEYNIENNISFSNEQLNDKFLSGKRKKFQIIFSIILYILGLLLLLFDFIFEIKIKEENYKIFVNFIREYSYEHIIIYSPPIFIVSILDIILASINVYYTKKYQNSRNTCASIISGINFFISLFSLFLLYNFFREIDEFCFFNDYTFNTDIIIIIIIIIFLNIIFSIILFFFNFKRKCCKCFN